MTELLGLVGIAAAVAFLTLPIWYPLWCLDRLAQAIRDDARARGGPATQVHTIEPDEDAPDDPDW